MVLGNGMAPGVMLLAVVGDLGSLGESPPARRTGGLPLGFKDRDYSKHRRN